jgi:hypothetical protein
MPAISARSLFWRYREREHPQRLCVIRSDPGDRFRRAVALSASRTTAARVAACTLLVPRGGDGSKPRAFRSTKNPVDDLALNQAAEEGNIIRNPQQANEPAACAEEFRGRFAGRHGGIAGRSLGNPDLLPAQNFTDNGHFEFQRHRRTGRLFTRLNDLTDNRQIDRRQQVSRLAIEKRGSAEVDPFSPLRDHRDARLIRHGTRSGGSSAPVKSQPRDIRCPILCRADKQGNPAGQFGSQLASNDIFTFFPAE